MASFNLLVALLVVWAAHLICTVSSRALDYRSDEDGSDQPPSDDSISAWKREDSWSMDEEDDDASLELNTESYDTMNDGITPLDFSSEEEPIKRNSSLLVDVYKKADLYSDAAVKFASIAEQKISDLSQRISNIRNMIIGPPGPPGQPGQDMYQDNDPNNNNGNDYDFNSGYSSSNRGGGGGYNSGGVRGSLIDSYNTIWPIIQEIGTWLNKLLQISTKIASKLFLDPAVQSRQIRRKGAKSKLKPQKAGKQYQKRGKSLSSAVAKRQNRRINDQRFYNNAPMNAKY